MEVEVQEDRSEDKSSEGLNALGLDARINAAQLVSPYRKQGASGKNDANDAEPGHKQS